MERPAARLSVLAVLVVCAVACSPESRPTAPTAPSPPDVVPLTPPAPGPFPTPSGNRRTYAFASSLTVRVADYTRFSRYVLYDDGVFELQYYGIGASYRGRYDQAESAVTFNFDGWSGAGQWGATGSLDGDTLTVRYNMAMVVDDFEDAVYRLQPD